MIAISMFLSSLTENQIVAAISSMGVAVFLMVIDQIGSIVSNYGRHSDHQLDFL
jgi:hypothetical protein